MTILKYMLLIFIAFVTSYIGFLKAADYEVRCLDLKLFQNALIMFKSKIEFTHEPIKNIFESISHIIYQDKDNVFLNTNIQDDSLYNSWSKAVDMTKKGFNNEDIKIIKSFGKLLGKTDINGQINEIELTLKLIEKQIENAEKEREKNSKLYKTLGITCGIGICIILI